MVALLQISCPHCGYSREVAEELLPGIKVTVTCPQCNRLFTHDRSTASAIRPPQPVFDEPERAQARLISVSDLFTSSWEFYKSRFGTLLAVYLLAMVLTFAPVIFTGIIAAIAIPSFSALRTGSGIPPALAIPFGAAVIAALLAMTYGMCWGFASFICALADKSAGIAGSFSKGRPFTFPLLWVVILQCLILFGGFILLIIPGIIFSVWYLFSHFACVCENERGMAALNRSRRYVKGYWLPVFGRVMLAFLAVSLLGAIPFVGGIISILLSPFTMIYLFVLYGELKKLKS